MRYLLVLLSLISALLVSRPAVAQDAPVKSTCDGTCVNNDDMAAIVQVLRDRKCLNEQKPTLKLDSISIITDEEGRVYGSGSAPKPYTVTMDWCNLKVTGTGTVQLLVAKREPAEWGFRFRLKFQSGLLFLDALKNKDVLSAVDVGFLFEPVYYHQFNLNVALGFRSLGAGVGMDITKNFGGYLGYALSFDSGLSNPYAGLWFGFW